MKFSWRTELPQWALIAGMFFLAAITWSWAPERIPVHWNLAGQVDRYGGKVEGLLMPPLLALGIYVGMLLLPRIDPGHKNYAVFRGAYATIRVALLTLLAGLYGVTHLVLRGYAADVGTIVPLAVGGLLVILGNLMGKIRPNWFVGVRTPWTLSSKESWVKTHRLAGWLFVVGGLALMVTSILHATWAAAACVGLLLVFVVITYVYSYLAWRDDPDKIPPAGTLPGP
jgi:uncharacterized membrane protein